MDPITLAVIVGAQAVSGIMQYYQSEKARKATSKRLKEIEALFDAIVPPDLNLKIWDNPAMVAEIPAPEFNLKAINESAYKSIGQYIPAVAQFVQETSPELVKATATAKEGRQAELDALRRYKEIAAGGFDPELEQQLATSSRKARIDAQARNDSVVQDANRRGQAGSGVALASQLQSSSDAMQRQALESQGAAVAAYRNRLGAMDRSAALGGDIRSSEMGEESRNVGIINDFNERTSRRRQEWQNQRTGDINQSRRYNLENDQDIANKNVGRRDTLLQQDFQNKRAQQDRQWEVEDRKNRLKQQMYENIMGKARGKAGIAQTGIDYMRQDTQDRNQVIRGVGDTISTGALYYGANGGGKSTPNQEDPNQFQDVERDPATQYGYNGRRRGRYE